MGRKSSVDTLSDAQRKHIEMRLRENRLTLDELVADLYAHFPDEENPSRSSLGRKKQKFHEMAKQMRQQDEMARMLVAELGENPDEKAGAFLVQSITTLATTASLNAQGDDDIDTKDIGRLARAAKDIMHTRKLSRDERVQIRKAAQEELLAEQEKRLEEERGVDGMSEQLEQRIRNILLGKS
jgi:hypothetical protein